MQRGVEYLLAFSVGFIFYFIHTTAYNKGIKVLGNAGYYILLSSGLVAALLAIIIYFGKKQLIDMFLIAILLIVGQCIAWLLSSVIR